ncbi:MAG: histidine kinase [Bacteroidales bacterium]|nr:histidine kinase [Bacteroidales bacterium]
MRYFVVILLCLFSFNIEAQEVVYKHFTTDNGLSSSTITQMLQDKQGNIWMTSSNGIMKFDGYTVVHFDVSTNLPDNEIISMSIDDEGKVWFLSKSGYFIYYANDIMNSYAYNDTIISIIKDFEIIEPKSFKIENNELTFNIFGKGRFHIDKQGVVDTLYNILNHENIIDLRNGKLEYFISFIDAPIQVYTRDAIYTVYIDDISCNEPVKIATKNQEVFLADQNLLHHIYKGELQTITYKQAISSIQIDTKGNLWIGFDSEGAFCYKNANITQSPHCSELRGNTVSSVIRDRDNSIWVSTLNNGMYFIPSELFRQVTVKDGLLDNNIKKLDFSNNYLWAITGNHAVARLHYLGLSNITFENPDFSEITDVFWSGGRLWLSFKNKLTYFEGEELVDMYKMDYTNGPHSVINGINAGINGDILISKSNGFARFSNAKLLFESSVEQFQALNVTDIIQEPNGVLWLACKNGLWKFDNNKLYNYNENNKILAQNITNISKDDELGALWLTITGTGVVKILNDSIWPINESSGLISNSVTSVFAYGKYIWVGTKGGISKIPVDYGDTDERILNITTKDGLISNEINDILVNKDYVFVATNQGVGYFDYHSFKLSRKSPDVFITDILINNHSLGDSLIDIKLDYFSNNLTISYKSIYFKSRGEVLYRYKLRNLDSDWTVTKNLQANYPFLPTGKYDFIVEAATESGYWSNNRKIIHIEVSSPFWMQIWFYIAILLLVVLAIVMVYSTRIQIRKKKERINREINEYRQMALTRQMNPHFIFNSLNAIQHYILQNDIRLSNKFLSKFSKLIRLILENSQSSLITLEKELVTLNLYLELEALRFKEKLQYQVEINPEIDILGTKLPPMLIQPYIENAIWHGIMNREAQSNGFLKIDFDATEDKIICVIEDNGVGREKSREINEKKNSTHKSMGTSITQNRIELINNIYKKDIAVEYIDKKDQNGMAIGTKVRITFSK